MPSYYPTLPSPPLQSPQYNAYVSNPWNIQPKWGYHSPSAYPTSVPPPITTHQPQIYMGKSAQTMLDRDPRPVHQGGMSTYDISGLANWVAANSFPNHAGPTDRSSQKAMAHPHQSRSLVSSKATTHDHHAKPSTATKRTRHSATLTTPEPRSCVKKGVQFTPSVQARDDEKLEAKNRTKSNGTRIKRMVCERCHVKPVDWTVDDEDYCDGCYRDSRKRRYGH